MRKMESNKLTNSEELKRIIDKLMKENKTLTEKVDDLVDIINGLNDIIQGKTISTEELIRKIEKV